MYACMLHAMQMFAYLSLMHSEHLIHTSSFYKVCTFVFLIKNVKATLR